MPKKKLKFNKKGSYHLLSEEEIIKETDEYYNPIKDKWLPVEKEFIGQEFFRDESKPVRRKMTEKEFLDWIDTLFPEFGGKE